MIALLRPEARPEDLYRRIEDFEWWRPVVLPRASTEPDAGNATATPSASTSADFGGGRKDETGPQVLVLRLDEDFDAACGTPNMRDTFSAALVLDLAASLRALPQRFEVRRARHSLPPVCHPILRLLSFCLP